MNFAEYNQLSLDLLSWNTKVSLSLSCFPLTITTEPEHTKFYNQLIYYLSPKINEDKLLLQCTYNVLYNFTIWKTILCNNFLLLYKYCVCIMIYRSIKIILVIQISFFSCCKMIIYFQFLVISPRGERILGKK